MQRRDKSATRNDIILCAAFQTCLDGMGGTHPSDLYDDMYTWFDAEDIVCPAINAQEAGGYCRSWQRKGWWVEDDEGSFFTVEGIDKVCEVWDEVKAWADKVRAS